jgi:hypothetical protein
MTAFAMGAIAASTARSIPIFRFIPVILYWIKTNTGRLLFGVKQVAQVPGKGAIDVVSCATSSKISADNV